MSENNEKTYCYKHPHRETRISCNECGRYICTSCIIQAPVGQKCPECVVAHESHVEKISPKEYLLSIVFGGLASAITCYVWNLSLNLLGGFIMAITSYMVGFIVAKTISKIIGKKIGFKIQVIAGTLVFIGLLYNPLQLIKDLVDYNYDISIIFTYLQRPVEIIISFVSNPLSFGGPFWFILSVVIAIWAAVRHFKF